VRQTRTSDLGTTAQAELTSHQIMESTEDKVESKLFWIISLPNSFLGPSGVEDLKVAVRHLTPTIQKFNVPTLRVGTLDSLMALSDELAKKDIFVDNVVKKIARQLVELYVEAQSTQKEKKSGKDKIQLMVNNVNLDTYLRQFQWDEAKYKRNSPLGEIVDSIVSTVGKLDEELRTMAGSYQAVSHSILAEQRKKTGNLMVRDIGDLIQPEDYIDTDNLCTLFVVISSSQSREWDKAYEDMLHDPELGGGVVPRSAVKLADDSDSQLYSIVMFKKLAEEWKKEICSARVHISPGFTIICRRTEETGEQETKTTAKTDSLVQRKLHRGLCCLDTPQDGPSFCRDHLALWPSC